MSNPSTLSDQSPQPVATKASEPAPVAPGSPSRNNTRRSSDLGRLVMIGLAAGVGIMLLKQLPDLKRYLKIRSM